MSTNTYVALKTTTVTGSPAASVTLDLSGISGYTDLVLISSVKPTTSGSGYINLQFNSDTSASYSRTYLNGNGSTATSGRNSGETGAYIYGNAITASPSTFITQIQNYSNTTTYKT